MNRFRRSHCKYSEKSALKNSFSEVYHVKFAVQNSWKIPMQKTIFSKVAGYKPINLYFFIFIVWGFASFRNPILKNSSVWLLIHFPNQIFKSVFFRQRVCAFILVNICNIMIPLHYNVVYYRKTGWFLYNSRPCEVKG